MGKFLIIEDNFNEIHPLIQEENNSKNLYITGPYIQLEKKNKNGRFYPKKNVNEAIQKYINEMIPSKRALGELNHASCFWNKTQALTEDGWKSISDVLIGENVFTLNNEIDEIELKPVINKHKSYYSGNMIRFKNRTFNTLVTPNHRFLIVRRNGNKEYVTAQEILENRQKYNKSHIPKKGKWNSNIEADSFTFPFLSKSTTNGVYLEEKFMQIYEESYEGFVHCLETENSNFFAMDDGYTFWTGNSPSINPDRVCHRTVELKEDGNDYIGKSLVLDTPCGRIVKGIYEGGGILGVSTRALGSLVFVKNKDMNEVQSDYDLRTIDVVADPSAPDAFVNGIMEGVEWIWENGVFRQQSVEESKKQIEKASSKRLPETKLYVFKRLMNELSN